MSYIIYTSSGTVLTTIPTGKINTGSTSLTLIGRDVSNYGRYVNQNFVNLLSNFANKSGVPPEHPLEGQLYFDTSKNKLKVYSDNRFNVINAALVSPTVPVGQEPGEFWFDAEHKVLNFIDDEGQYQSVTSFPRSNISGWHHPLNPVYDSSLYIDMQQVVLLQSYGEVMGSLSTASFVASSDDSLTVFERAGTSEFEVVSGLTIIGDVRATHKVKTHDLQVSGSVNLTYELFERNYGIPEYANQCFTMTSGVFLAVNNTETAAERIITLPPVSEGRIVTIKDESGWASQYPITLVPAVSTTTSTLTLIDGQEYLSIAADYGKYKLFSDGFNWFVEGGDFVLSSVQEGNHITSITGRHDISTGISVTSEEWAQLMWVPSTQSLTVADIGAGTDEFNWIYVSSDGLHVENRTSTSTIYSWNFKTNGSLVFPNGSKIVSANVTPVVGTTATVHYYNYDASNLTVSVQAGDTVDFPNFSGQVLINDHVSGGVDLWIAGGGSTVLLGHTVTQTGTLAQNAGINGYTWTSAIAGTMVFVATRTRSEA